MKKKVKFVLVFCIFCIFIVADSNVNKKKKNTEVSAAAIFEKDIDEYGIEAAKEKLQELKSKKGSKYSFKVSEFISLGNKFLKENKTDTAIEVLKQTTEIFDTSSRALYALAVAYRSKGDQEKFYEYFKKMHGAREKEELHEFLKKNEGQLLSSAEEVVKRHVESTGGLKAWKKIKTMSVKIKLLHTEGSAEILARYYKYPSFFRQGILGSGTFTATDGKKVWAVKNNEWKEISVKPFLRMACMPDLFLDYKKKGINYKYVGVEVLNHSPVYHLKRIFQDGYEEDLYFSIKTGYLTEKLTPYNLGPTYFTLWDYRKVGDLLFPYVFIRSIGDFGPPHGGIIQEIKINTPLDDSLFVKKE